MNGAPKVSVIIPVHNRAQDLAECLDSLARQTYPKDKFEVIVVDNDSTDASAQTAHERGATVVAEPRRGAAHARNRGVAYARNRSVAQSGGALVAFTDSDCVAAADWLEKLAEPFTSDETLGFCGGAVEPYSLDTPLQRYIADRGIMSQERFCQKERFSFPFFMTANAMFTRRALEAAGPFDEAVAPGEDADLCWRAAWAGYRWQYIPQAVVRHKHRPSLAAFARQVRGYGVGSVNLFKKHRERFDCRWYLDQKHYGRMLRAAGRLALKGCFRPQEERLWMLYDVISYWSYALGRVLGSLRNRVLFL